MLNRIILVAATLAVLSACSPLDRDELSDAQFKNDTWRLLNFPAADWKHDDVFFLDRNIGWTVVNTKGQIYKTEDGGANWALQFAPAEQPYFRCIGFADSRNGFACNLSAAKRNNPLYRTIDGGSAWFPVSLDAKVDGFCGISIVNTETIFLTGRYPGPAYFAKSEDGGDTWAVSDMSEYMGRGVDVHFWNERDGLLLGGSAIDAMSSRVIILGTSDGGSTWTERYRGPRHGEWGWKFTFPSRDIGYASVDTEPLDDVGTAYFLKTEDGGQTWQRKPFFKGQYRAQGIGFQTEDQGWIGSFLPNRPTLATSDGGETWTEANFGDRINRFRFIEGAGFAAGNRLYRIDSSPAKSGGG